MIFCGQSLSIIEHQEKETAVDFITNRGTQQENITTAINPLADLTRSQVWDLDALGNFSSLENNGGAAESRTHNLQNQVTAVGSVSVSYDSNGNITLDDQGRTLVWDAWNRLVEVKEGSTTLVEYQYDGLKRRIVEDDGTNERHLYYSDQWQVIEEQISGGTTVQYVWSPVYVDSMILRDRDADANTGNGFESRGLEERIYVLHDANYNVTALTDASGDVLERSYYEAYGQPVYLDESFDLLADAESQHAWQHLHQGGRLDAITGNYHFRNRDLSPSLGRWISQDPIGFEGSPWNLYEYLKSSPTRFQDPSGLEVAGGFGSSLGNSFYSIGQTYYGIGQFLTGDYGGAAETWDAAYENGPLGQTQEDDGFYYYGTRGSLGVATAAVVTATAVGSAEVLLFGNEPILVEGVLGGTNIGSGGILQLRPRGKPPLIRIDYHPFKPNGPNIPHIDSPPLGWHHWPWK